VVFDADTAALTVDGLLRPFGTRERAEREKRYLKSDLEFFGVTVPDLRRAVKEAVKGYPGLDHQAAVAWAAALWREPVFERRMAAVEVLSMAGKQLRAFAPCARRHPPPASTKSFFNPMTGRRHRRRFG